jgi:proteasome component ECM29
LDVVIGRSSAKTAENAGAPSGSGEDDDEEDEEDEETERQTNRKHLPPPNPIRTNFGMVYMTLGVPRLSGVEQAALLPSLIDGLTCATTASQKYSILRLMVEIIPNIPIPTEIDRRREAMAFLNEASDANRQMILDFWFDVLLYRRPPLLSQSAVTRANALSKTPPPPGNNVLKPGQTVYYLPTGDVALVVQVHPDGINPYYTVLMPKGNEKQTTRQKLSDTYLPAGLSAAAKANILGPSKTELPQKKLNLYKEGIIKIIGSNVFPDIWVLRHILAARADSNNVVIELGNDIYRRLPQGRPELEEPTLVRALLQMCVGDMAQSNKAKGSVRKAVGQALKLRILEDLLRSRVCAQESALCVKVVFDCLYGTGTTPKHRIAGIRLCKWCFESSSDASLNVTAPLLSSGVQKTLVGLIGNSADQESRRLREYCYSALSVLAPRKPVLFSGNLELPLMCFEGLLENDNEFRASAQEALSGLAAAYAHSSPEILEKLMAMLLKYAESKEYRARLCSVQMATRIFQADHVPTRYLCMMLSADARQEVRFAALKGIFGFRKGAAVEGEGHGSEEDSSSGQMADFCKLVGYLESKDRLRQLRALEMSQSFKYIGKCFQGYLKTTDGKVEKNEDLKQAVTAYASSLNFGLESDPAAAGASELFCQAALCVGDLAEVVPEMVGPSFSDDASIRRLKSWLSNTNEDLRTAAARVLKLTVKFIPAESMEQLVEYLLERAVDDSASKQTAKHGSISALGSIVIGTTAESSCPRERIVKCILSTLKNESKKSPMPVMIAACNAVGGMGKAGRLVEEESLNGVTALLQITKTKSEEANKLIERAVVAVGNICETQKGKAREMAIEGLLKMHLIKYEEIQFAVGETFARIGVADLAATDIASDEVKKEGMATMGQILQSTLTELKDARPSVRSAAAIWLLSLVKFAGSKCSLFRERLWDLQAAFTLLLGERSQFLQELGGKGLSLIHEIADEKQRKKLLASLVRSFSTGKRQQVEGASVDIYGEGGPAGAALSAAGSQSYKQMCAAATDMGDPSLIYKFLSLSSEHAQWNSRRGASFGIAELAGEAGMEALRQQLGAIVPRLYRSRFSPDPKNRIAMHRLWESLVGKKSKKTIDKYFGKIITLTLPALADPQWREREAACEALNDLLSIGRKAVEVLPYLDTLWESAMKVADDIKETVAVAAVKLVKSLGKLTVRLCDPKQTLKPQAEKCFATLLPFFIEKGVVDACKSTRALSMHFLIKIVRGAGNLLTVHVPVIAPVLLEYLSAMESQDLVYLQFHTDKMNISAERLEELRLQVAQSGPFAESLQLCLQYVKKSGIEKLVPSLAQLIRNGTGLATRNGTANFITDLAVQKPKKFKPYASPLLNPLAGGLNDRSATVRRAYSKAIAQVAKLSKSSSVRKLLVRITDQYKTADPSDSGDKVRHTSGMVLLALANAAPSKLKKRLGELIPLTFMAKFSKNNQVKRGGVEVWEALTSTTAAGVKAHIKGITNLMLECLDASSYEIRRQGAEALTEAIGVAGDASTGEMPRIVETLTKVMSGRYWAGKEAVLRSVVAVVKASETTNSEHNGRLIELMLRECKREVDDSYVRDCVDSLGRLVETLADSDYYASVSKVVLEIEERARKDEPLLRARAIECLGRCWPKCSSQTQKETIGPLIDLLGTSMKAALWRVRVAIVSTVTMMLEKVLSDVSNSHFLSTSIEILNVGAKDVKYHQVRSEVAKCILTIAKRAGKDAEAAALFKQPSDQIRDIARLLSGDGDPTTQQRSQLARDSLGKTYGLK